MTRWYWWLIPIPFPSFSHKIPDPHYHGFRIGGLFMVRCANGGMLPAVWRAAAWRKSNFSADEGPKKPRTPVCDLHFLEISLFFWRHIMANLGTSSMHSEDQWGNLVFVYCHVGFPEGCLRQPLFFVEAWKSWNTRVFPPIPCRPCDCEGNHGNLLPPKNATWDFCLCHLAHTEMI